MKTPTRILAIETSCDETAVSILECEGTPGASSFRVLGNALLSQIDIHKEYGGVFPAIAKREHAKNLVPLLEAALEEAELLHESEQAIPDELRTRISLMLEREPELGSAFFDFLSTVEVPSIDAIAVTSGPGLAPALWVGVNFAQALAILWDKPLVPVNHMEGHLLAALATSDVAEGALLQIEKVELPVLALLISGGHTELVSMPEWGTYTLVGATRDDAAGEAFDKVARMLELPYPGGPEVSRLAERSREDASANQFTFPRPMLREQHCDFSFSGLKTSVLYAIKDRHLSEHEKEQVARAFEDAVADVLYAKTSRALDETGAKTLVLGGGVSGNIHIQRTFAERLPADHPETMLRVPARALTTDNAIMIGVAGYHRFLAHQTTAPGTLIADGNLSLSS